MVIISDDVPELTADARIRLIATDLGLVDFRATGWNVVIEIHDEHTAFLIAHLTFSAGQAIGVLQNQRGFRVAIELNTEDAKVVKFGSIQRSCPVDE
jgi:hypothetical protein